MTEHEPTPEEEAEVTRLLAEAGGPVAMPESVASRLDDVLADLLSERSTPAAVPTRRRRWPQVLVAAAAVSVIGYAGSVLVSDGSSLDDGGGDAAGAADEGASLREVPPTASTTADEEAADADGQQRDEAPGLPQSPDRVDGMWFSYTAENPGTSAGSPNKVTRCRVPELAVGYRFFELTPSEGGRAVVVVRPLNGSAARADLYPCRRPLFPVASSLLLAAR
jgi:hypothetical protein